MNAEEDVLLGIAHETIVTLDTVGRWGEIAIVAAAAVHRGLIGGRARQSIFTAFEELTDALIASFDQSGLEKREEAQEKAVAAYFQFRRVVEETFSGVCYPLEFVATDRVKDISARRKTA